MVCEGRTIVFEYPRHNIEHMPLEYISRDSPDGLSLEPIPARNGRHFNYAAPHLPP